jgi:hypothetical protein
MPQGIMGAPAANGAGMPSGQMRDDDHPGFTPVSGDMPRGDMASMGGLGQMTSTETSTILSEMPGAGMETAQAAAPAGLEMRGTFRLELSPGSFSAG